MRYNLENPLPSFSFCLLNLIVLTCVTWATTDVSWGQRILPRESAKPIPASSSLSTPLRPVIQVVRRPVYSLANRPATTAGLPPWRLASPTQLSSPANSSPSIQPPSTPLVGNVPATGAGTQAKVLAPVPTTSPVPNLSSGNGKWYPYVIARGSDRDRIKEMPIEQRPYRPLHFYGNTVRRNMSRQSSSRAFSRR